MLKYEGVDIGIGQVMRSFLHWDKHQDPSMKDRAKLLFPKWRAFKDSVMEFAKKCTIPTLERYGWSKTVGDRRAKKRKA